MSNVSTRHTFTPLVSQGKDKSVALSGQRLAVCRFKTGKSGAKAIASQCCSVPMVQLEAQDYEVLSGHIAQWFAGVQDDIIRELVIAGKDAVESDQISVDAVSQYLRAQAAGDRLNGEQIKYWFDGELLDVLTVAFADKLGVGDSPSEADTTKISQMCNVYRDSFAAMAGGRTVFDASKRAKLEKALSLADCTDGIGARLAAKLQSMKEVSVEEMLGL